MRTLVLTALALVIVHAPTLAEAQRSETLPPAADGIRIGGGLVTGFAGSLDLDYENGTSADDNLLATVGFDVFVEYAFMRYVAIGARSSLVWWNADDFDDVDIGRSFLWTFDIQPKARVPFAIEELGAEVFLALPLGLTVSAPNGDIPGEPNTAPGFNLAIMGGFALWFTEQLGVYTQLGWQWHWVGHELTAGFLDGVDVSARISQLRWTFGMTFAL